MPNRTMQSELARLRAEAASKGLIDDEGPTCFDELECVRQAPDRATRQERYAHAVGLGRRVWAHSKRTIMRARGLVNTSDRLDPADYTEAEEALEAENWLGALIRYGELVMAGTPPAAAAARALADLERGTLPPDL